MFQSGGGSSVTSGTATAGTTSGGDSIAGLKGSKTTNASSQLLHMQRLLAASQRGARNGGYFNDNTNFGDMEFARQLQQRAGGPTSQSSWGRDEFVSPLLGFGAGNRSSSSGDYMSSMSVTSIRGYVFKCPDCAFNKNSCEDLEIHIKTEHLNWLPFQCPFCHQNRASDSQMREHIHSVHKKPENKYFYVDNVVAKRMLQEMIDRALFNTSMNATSATSMRASVGGPRGNGYAPFFLNNNSNGMFPFGNNSNNNVNNNNYFMNENENAHSPNNNGNGNNNGNRCQNNGNAGAASPARKQLKSATSGGLPQRRGSHDNDERHSNASANNSDDYGEGSAPGGSATAVTVLTKKTLSGDDLLAQLQQQLVKSRGVATDDDEADEGEFFGGSNGGGGDEEPLLDDETSAQLSQIFGTPRGLVKADFDLAANDAGGNELSEFSGLHQGNGDFSGASDDNDTPAPNSGGGGHGNSKSHNDVLQNLSAIFSAAANGGGMSMAADALKMADAHAGGSLFNGTQSPIRLNHNNNPIRRRAPRGCGSNQSISKKRVLGECASCHKPITAGARQMHMFYHLGKDHNTYRFRCKHENCDVEHYRKDQMENHHSKAHGKIEADMMEDRSLELYDMCQKMSMELLGTVGNTPGPTAAKAQILYDNMQREAEMAAFRKRKRNRSSGVSGGGRTSFLLGGSHIGSAGISNVTPFAAGATRNNVSNNNGNNNNNRTAHTNSNNNMSNNGTYNNLANKQHDNMDGVNADFIRSIQQQLNQQRSTLNSGNYNDQGFESGGLNNSHLQPSSYTKPASLDTRQEDIIECKLCQKSMVGRTRGFHILWHLNTDLGIIRYACTQCDFKHDRPQSVSTHGRKEHDDEDCVNDLINNYEEEVRSMSKACFGREQLFAKEERRRSRIERALAEQDLMNKSGGDEVPAPITTSDDDRENSNINERVAQSGAESLFTIAENPADEQDNSTAKPITMPPGPRNVVKISLSKMSSTFADEKPAVTPASEVLPPSTSIVTSFATSSSSKRKSRSGRFGIRRPKSRKQREEMAKLREVSMRLGGAQYFKKRSSESIPCEKCGKYNTTRLSHHAYNHLEDCSLYLCPQCNMGHCSRDVIVKHLKDFHDSVEPPTDNRLKYAREIKEVIRECYPSCFVDAPIPTPADIERLKANLKLSDRALATFDGENENEVDENEHDDETTMDDDSLADVASDDTTAVADVRIAIKTENDEFDDEEKDGRLNIDEDMNQNDEELIAAPSNFAPTSTSVVGLENEADY